VNLEELIERLQELVEDHEAGEWDIQIAQQPNYPLVGFLEAVSFNPEKKEIYLASANATEYGKRAMWEDYQDLSEEEEDED
jgi:hypothetical protein